MKRSHALALSAVTLFLASSAASQAQVVRPGQQCQPAVADASMYGDCRLRIVRGEEVCRCAILPQALRSQNPQDRDNLATGSISPLRQSGSGTLSDNGGRSVGASGTLSATASGSSVGAGSTSSTGSSVGAGASVGAGSSTGGAVSAGAGTASSGAVGGGSTAVDGSPGSSLGGGSTNAPGGKGNNGNGQGPGSNNGNGQGPGNNNGLGNGSEPADNTSTDVKGTDPSNPGGGNGGGNGGSNGGGNGGGNGRGSP
ncbi:hypothetical protein SAMN02927923_02525 [Microvirga guangxiensis]|uniref:Glycine rich protein n=1 Tax=Microvirga guangxiensis TaxID=549386 RepID=A0A1G5J7K1_9HYPH|nr:hypothetical protein SAMN02927923_02525 [Microvirga guangxiensis]